MSRPFSFLAPLVLALAVCAAPASATQLDLKVTSSPSAKLKGSQHAHLQLPDPAKITPVLGDSSAAEQRGVDLASGACRTDFTAKALFQHTVGGQSLKQHALNFHNIFVGTPHIFSQGRIHNSRSKLAGKKVSAYQAAGFATDDPGQTNYNAHAIFQFTPAPRRIHGFKVKRPATTETEVYFEGGQMLQEDGHDCTPADKAAVEAKFASAIASTQLTN